MWAARFAIGLLLFAACGGKTSEVELFDASVDASGGGGGAPNTAGSAGSAGASAASAAAGTFNIAGDLPK